MDKAKQQELFDKAYRGLASQGFQQSRRQVGESEDLGPNNSYCRYRGPEGRKCAVGWLFPDGVEVREGLLGTDHLQILGIDDTMENYRVLSKLQWAHDAGDTPEYMRELLAAFAEEYGLTVPTV